MSRILVSGLPRSGTTWLSRTLATAPGVKYVHEPDNREVDPFAWLATRGIETRPSLTPGDEVPDYRLMWELAFAGGWPQDAVMIAGLHRLGSSPRVPRILRVPMLRRAAKAAARREPQGAHQLVKSVAASLAIEWIAHEFDPRVVVVWRHPLNLVPAWIEQGWRTADKASATPAIRSRFETTPAWPPPTGEGVRAVAWAVCAESVPLLETAHAHPSWRTVSHEQQSLRPLAAFRELFDHLELSWTDDVEQQLMATDRSGSGFATNRRSAEEARRWQSRLTGADQDEILATVELFEKLSPVSADLWRASPAMV
jgi:hypothetical protein